MVGGQFDSVGHRTTSLSHCGRATHTLPRGEVRLVWHVRCHAHSYKTLCPWTKESREDVYGSASETHPRVSLEGENISGSPAY